jgi:hypothetical protein
VAERAAELVWTVLKNKKSLSRAGNEPRFLGRPARSVLSVPIMLSNLLINNDDDDNNNNNNSNVLRSVVCTPDEGH